MKAKMIQTPTRLYKNDRERLIKKARDLKISVGEYMRLAIFKCLEEDLIKVAETETHPFKTCLICNEEKPNDVVHFHQLKRHSNIRGHYQESSPYCIPCHNKRNTELNRIRKLKNK